MKEVYKLKGSTVDHIYKATQTGETLMDSAKTIAGFIAVAAAGAFANYLFRGWTNSGSEKTIQSINALKNSIKNSDRL